MRKFFALNLVREYSFLQHLKHFCYILLCIVFGTANAQINLVQNSSFEQYSNCPTNAGQLNFAVNWINPNYADPDYFNSCSAFFGVPSHFGEFQPARTGNAYAGFFTFGGNMTNNGREYVEGKLSRPLITGRKYCVSFYLCLSDRMMYATDAFGAYLSTDSLKNDTSAQCFMIQPQIENSAGNVITDTMNWVLVSGEFIASGGEQFITIGSFRINSATIFDTTGWGTDPRAYYYLDDVSVTYCGPDTAPALQVPSYVGPHQLFSISNLPAGTALILFSTLGQQVYYSDNYNNDLNSSMLSAGIYFCRTRRPDGTEQSAKVFFQH